MADDPLKGNESNSSISPNWLSSQKTPFDNKIEIQVPAPTASVTNCATNSKTFLKSDIFISTDINLSNTSNNQGSTNNDYSVKIKSRSNKVKLHNRCNEEVSSIKRNASLTPKIHTQGKGSHGFQNKVKKGKGDLEFTPSIDMMIHDYDDERTLDEEESLVALEDPQIELTSLQKEGDMPLADLMAMYGYQELTEKSDSAEEMNGDNPVESNMAKKTEPSELEQLYDDSANDTETNIRSTRYVSRQQSEDEEDIDYSPEEEEKKKTIMVGSDYQAWIPEGLCKYDDALPYENEDKLVWDPWSLTPNDIEDYLIKAQEPLLNNSQGVTSIPRGAHTRDDEQALYLLLQCGYNIEEALRRRRINAVPPNDSMSLWSEEECRNFENGLRCFGKDFRQIHQHKVKTRSVGELVQFYYLWKKTERHDIFANKARLEKKKYSLHPGITDYMDRFLEEQDGPCSRDRSVSPNMQSLVYGESNSHMNNVSNSDEKEGIDEYSSELSKMEKHDKEKKIFNANDKILLKPKKNDQMHP